MGYGASFPRNLGEEELRLSYNPTSTTDDSDRRLHDLEIVIRKNQGDIDTLYGLLAGLTLELASLIGAPVVVPDESMVTESEEAIPSEFEAMLPLEDI